MQNCAVACIHDPKTVEQAIQTGLGNTARTILEVDAPGPANPSLHRLPYQKIPRPIWPLDE